MKVGIIGAGTMGAGIAQEGGLLNLHVLRGNLDDQVTVCADVL